MDGFLIIVGIYVVLTVLGAYQKKQRLAREQLQREMGTSREGTPTGPAAPAEQLTGLERALEALRRAELEAKARAEAQRRLPLAPGRGGLLPQSRRAAELPVFDYDSEALEDTEDSEEEIFPVEAINLDEESAREVEERDGAVERYRAPRDVALEVPAGSGIVSRIQSAIVPSIPSAEAEQPKPMARPAARRTPLGRFATGRVRDAVVLSEILGRPVGERF